MCTIFNSILTLPIFDIGRVYAWCVYWFMGTHYNGVDKLHKHKAQTILENLI